MQLTTTTRIVRASNAVAAGTTNASSAVIDTAGYRSVRFAVLFGTIVTGALTTVKIQDGNASDGSDQADVAGSHTTVADTNDNQLVVVELTKPLKRYVSCVVTRSTQNATIDGIIAELYGARSLPVSQTDATVVGDLALVSPADGTA